MNASTTLDTATQARLDRLRTLAAPLSEQGRRWIQGALDNDSPRDLSKLRYAASVTVDGETLLIAGADPAELASVLSTQVQEQGWRPQVLIDLDDGKWHFAAVQVKFMPASIALPPVVGDVLSNALAGREGDGEEVRDPEREAQLCEVIQLIDAQLAVPCEHFAMIADAIELDLEDRRKDPERDPRAERELAEIHQRLLGKGDPWI